MSGGQGRGWRDPPTMDSPSPGKALRLRWVWCRSHPISHPIQASAAPWVVVRPCFARAKVPPETRQGWAWDRVRWGRGLEWPDIRSDQAGRRECVPSRCGSGGAIRHLNLPTGFPLHGQGMGGTRVGQWADPISDVIRPLTGTARHMRQRSGGATRQPKRPDHLWVTGRGVGVVVGSAATPKAAWSIQRVAGYATRFRPESGHQRGWYQTPAPMP